MSKQPEQVEFTAAERTPAHAAMVELAARRAGWMNVFPGVEDDAPPGEQRGLAGFLLRSGPPVPMGTWVAPTTRRGKPVPASVGVQHGTGPRALPRLVEAGVALPEGWVRVQDHVRRGVVLRLPNGAEPPAVLDWLLGALTMLCPVTMTGWWLAEVHRT